jgi:hypothetical protein
VSRQALKGISGQELLIATSGMLGEGSFARGGSTVEVALRGRRPTCLVRNASDALAPR